DVEIQSSLVNSLSHRNDSQKGVNLDEELSQLILYEQAYSAAARIISVIQTMFETLEGAVR
ncbi:flagellar basal body rod C-terminal domain-containing protein, partial [Desulfosediminicola sp.]